MQFNAPAIRYAREIRIRQHIVSFFLLNSGINITCASFVFLGHIIPRIRHL